MKRHKSNTAINIFCCSLSLLALMLCSTARAQNSYDSSFRFYYYDQKLSMFEQLPDQEGEVVWMGDSITDGGEWSELFPQLTTLNRGISSDNTFGVLHRLKEVTRRKPRTLFLLVGINDIARNIPAQVILSNHARIIQQVRAASPSTIIYLQTLLPTNNEFTDFPKHQNKTDMVLAVNNGLRQLAQQENIHLIDLYPQFLDATGKLSRQYTNDGLHLTGAGYQHWKDILIQSGAIQ